MTIMSEDGIVLADVGNSEYWLCFYSTIITKLDSIKDQIPLAIKLLENGTCEAANCIETARQLNLIRDNLSRLATSELVCDYKDPNNKKHKLPEISPIVTSCGNFFSTADGKDLIFEINSILCYAAIKKISVIAQ